ncbi:5-dehydro-4-deoxy-D-glucuronate isomerase [Hymenobacter taeanensis]|uniref:4-deoxy-L-threo-5-hexosulose-uronate ketol-isomerase n=1 Tax=Hymenobacter taeanensis TaxID=2735321 RepID=A0A6M6BIP7_9BACT|nr:MULTISPECIES: 5-dehydro-4-deoxy-D-glucuronate isomerase [Hymenobacter]QJX47996.1 5-dehydro-4-deoxy-D-glucuronate isomerase [Hymenobacter taeanensis]UOQ82556.1 5-dehydro-4-deoxy-D-glucuronate isomerase [Hymenobacter sp. 5414T-23]
MTQRYAIGPRETAGLNTKELRNNFLIESLFVAGGIELVYTHYDRMIVGGATPTTSALPLPCPENLKAQFFLERRELGILNIGQAGTVTVDGKVYELGEQDCLYVGKGAQEVVFASADAVRPAKYYLLSAPAHAVYPTTRMTQAESTPVEMGATETANERTIYKYIYLQGIQSCQLVMGLTKLKPGSVWNTMPSHVHDRRMEAYLYFNLPENQRVLHMMGEPHETRPLWVSNEQAILSPPWSIHTGCGTSNYTFIWGMAGENLEYTDMDAVSIHDLS